MDVPCSALRMRMCGPTPRRCYQLGYLSCSGQEPGYLEKKGIIVAHLAGWLEAWLGVLLLTLDDGRHFGKYEVRCEFKGCRGGGGGELTLLSPCLLFI